ncbi:hypothetical protein AJ80_07154 [Polytolypa hystricis UAMH7299]|uniref:CN hydrolase domain-containing protein n=1 Tax=Polytolypa hystricis (strain UAMH7299) TaxID=1447883 RepID=A0A2B7XRH8_POLH7|nr:hypothetical protein AJ80_07154 [Polytolypa hystricis UAMH7299]
MTKHNSPLILSYPLYNFNATVTHIREAASNNASLAVLPEYHLTGWLPGSTEFASLAATAWQYVIKYQDVAKELNINIVPGTIVTTDPNLIPPEARHSISEEYDRLASNGKSELLFNIAPFISQTGELLGVYTKANLWHPERAYLTSHPPISLPGNESGRVAREAQGSPHTVIDTPLGPVGLLVCWDLAFPEAFRSLIGQGARLIIIPTFWLGSDISPEAQMYNKNAERLFLQSTIVSRAFENTCAIIFCNAGGPAEEDYLGLSQVALPLVGTVPGSFEGSEVGLRILSVDMDVVDTAEKTYKIRETIGMADWHYGHSHK